MSQASPREFPHLAHDRRARPAGQGVLELRRPTMSEGGHTLDLNFPSVESTANLSEDGDAEFPGPTKSRWVSHALE